MLKFLLEYTLFYLCIPLFVYLLYKRLYAKKYKLPPGPTGWPFIGTIPDPVTSPLTYKRLLEGWRDKYGDTILFKRWGMNVVYVSDYRLGFEAFSKTNPKELAGRPFFIVDSLAVGNEDIFVTKSLDPTWAELRKQIMIIFRKVAASEKMASIAKSNYESFAKHIRENKESLEKDGFYIRSLAYWLAHNILVEVLWQEAIEPNNPDYLDTIRTLIDIQECLDNIWFMEMSILNLFPNPNKQKILNYGDHILTKIKNCMDQQRKDDRYKLDPTYFVDYFIQIQDKQKEDTIKSSNLPELDDNYIARLALDIYFAGLDGFGIGFTWTVGLLATHPHVQEKIRKELGNMATETGESFNVKWMNKLHYLNAVINEVMRVHSLSSFTTFHRAMSDAKIGEYDIPKNTIVTLNIYGMHHDPRYWKNPHEFNPERFLNDEGKFQLPKEGFMPFGVGRRICIAERYTVKETHFVFTGRICQDFQIVWSSKNNGNKVEEDMTNTFFRHTAPFFVEFIPLK